MIDLTGERFGRLIVRRKAFVKPNGVHWRCECACGNKLTVLGGHLRRPQGTRSCGCWRRKNTGRLARKRRANCAPEDQPNLRHGHFANGRMTATYQSWHMMIQRCTNPERGDYERYGGRGITVCKRWLDSFKAFFADMGERPPGKTLDRYPNPDGNYKPSNCRWATPPEQQQNKRQR